MAAHQIESTPAAVESSSTIRWRHVVSIIAIVFLARVAYLWLLNSSELVADEAHYWEWSRRPDWSYYTKGPGVAWVIWLSTHLFGTSEASVRLPSAMASAFMTLAGARLAFDITGRDARAGLNAAIALTLAPAYFLLAQILYTDTFWCAGWTIATWLVFHATRLDASAGRRSLCWTAAGFIVGLTCLFKYTELFFIPGVALYLFVCRRDVRWDRAMVLGLVGGAIALLIAASPIAIWNATRGWPTIAHQVGRIRLPGGDESVDWGWSPMWFLSFAGAQIAMIAVVGAALIVLAIRHERRVPQPDTVRRLGTRLLLYVSLPLIVFYLALSVARQAQGNWAVAGYSTLLVLVGISVTDALHEHAAIVRAWLALPEPRPRAGRLKRRPETPFQVLWHWYIGIGIVVGAIMLVGPALLKLPAIRKNQVLSHALARASGAAERAAAIAAIADAQRDADGRWPLLIADRYQDASLLAFYMPTHPVVYSAASHLGSRPTAYDFFHDTDLSAPSLKGRRALLIGGDVHEWKAAFGSDAVRPVGDSAKVLLLEHFNGLPNMKNDLPNMKNDHGNRDE